MLVPGSLWKRAESWLEPAGTRIPDLDHANVGSDCDWIETESGTVRLRGSAFFISFFFAAVHWGHHLEPPKKYRCMKGVSL